VKNQYGETEVLISGIENPKTPSTDIDKIELNLLHYLVSLVTCYCQYYCSVLEVSKLGRTIIASYGKMRCTAEPAADYTPSTHFLV